MNLDECDLKILKENFSEDTIRKIDIQNVEKIFEYLNENKIYYAEDLLLCSLDLFILPYGVFVDKFENLKRKIGNNFVEELGENISLIEIMY